LHLLYDRALDNPGVSYMQSADGGETWSEPVDVSGETPSDEFAISVRMVLDGRGWLHAGWHHRRMTPDGIYPAIARYARSEDGGRTWTEPMTVEAGVGAAFVNPIVDKQDNVHLFWIGPGGQRYHRWSSDGGYTWTKPEQIFPGLTGHWNGWVAAAVDSAGTLHAVTGGVISLYSRWTGTTWTEPVAVDPVTGCDSGPHFFDLAITEGNLLHLVRHASTITTSTVCYSSLRTSAPYVLPQPLPTPVATPTRQVPPTATLAPTVTLTRTPAATPNVSAAPPESMAGSNASFAIVMGIVPAVLLVGLVVLVQIMRGKGRF
jgi:hypothetical protein